MLYFSYGANMSQENMDNFCKKVNRPFINMRDHYYQKGILKGYKIDFEVNDARLGGVLNLMPSDEDNYVEGVVFEMSDKEMKTFDMKEAAAGEFCRTPLPITLDDGRVLNDVIVYTIACKEYLVEATPPSETYKRDIIEAAKAFGLSKEWIEKLKKLPSPEFCS